MSKFHMNKFKSKTSAAIELMSSCDSVEENSIRYLHDVWHSLFPYFQEALKRIKDEQSFSAVVEPPLCLFIYL